MGIGLAHPIFGVVYVVQMFLPTKRLSTVLDSVVYEMEILSPFGRPILSRPNGDIISVLQTEILSPFGRLNGDNISVHISFLV